jgi:hypothetical protein
MANDRFFSNFEVVESQNDYTEEPFDTSDQVKTHINTCYYFYRIA